MARRMYRGRCCCDPPDPPPPPPPDLYVLQSRNEDGQLLWARRESEMPTGWVFFDSMVCDDRSVYLLSRENSGSAQTPGDTPDVPKVRVTQYDGRSGVENWSQVLDLKALTGVDPPATAGSYSIGMRLLTANFGSRGAFGLITYSWSDGAFGGASEHKQFRFSINDLGVIRWIHESNPSPEYTQNTILQQMGPGLGNEIVAVGQAVFQAFGGGGAKPIFHRINAVNGEIVQTGGQWSNSLYHYRIGRYLPASDSPNMCVFGIDYQMPWVEADRESVVLIADPVHGSPIEHYHACYAWNWDNAPTVPFELAVNFPPRGFWSTKHRRCYARPEHPTYTIGSSGPNATGLTSMHILAWGAHSFRGNTHRLYDANNGFAIATKNYQWVVTYESKGAAGAPWTATRSPVSEGFLEEFPPTPWDAHRIYRWTGTVSRGFGPDVRIYNADAGTDWLALLHSPSLLESTSADMIGAWTANPGPGTGI